MKTLSYYVNVVAIEDKGHHVVSEGATPESCSGALADAAMMLPPARRLVIVVYCSSALENFVNAVSLAHNGLGEGKNGGRGIYRKAFHSTVWQDVSRQK